ncbi:CatA-like O-acetyltransferase [Bacillus cereus]
MNVFGTNDTFPISYNYWIGFSLNIFNEETYLLPIITGDKYFE